VLATMEGPAEFTDDVGRGPLASVAVQVRRIDGLLQDILTDAGAAQHRGRLAKIRQKLDRACRKRFTEALDEALFKPLTASAGPVDAAHQKQFETSARDLRTFETAARKAGGSAEYDGLLKQACEAVKAATNTGALTPMRRLRLVEILSGPEAAKALLRDGIGKP
jgi:hypothetical protein